MDPLPRISPEALQARLRGDDPPLLLDVREPWEHALAALPGARLIPLEELPWRLDELEPGRKVVVYCHHGIRSATVVEWLCARGVAAVNLEGGIDAWARTVDPGMPRY